MSDKTASPTQVFDEMFKTWRDNTLNQWAAVSQQMVEAEPVTQMMKASFDTVLAGQKQMRQGVNTWLESLDLPNREDLARLSKQTLAAETRVAECEDQIDALRAEVDGLGKLVARQAAQIEMLVAHLRADRATAVATPQGVQAPAPSVAAVPNAGASTQVQPAEGATPASDLPKAAVGSAAAPPASKRPRK